MKLDKKIYHLARLLIDIRPKISKYNWTLYELEIRAFISEFIENAEQEPMVLYESIHKRKPSKEFIDKVIKAIEAEALYNNMEEAKRNMLLSIYHYNPNSNKNYFLELTKNAINNPEITNPLRYQLEIYLSEINEQASYRAGISQFYVPSAANVHDFLYRCLEDICASLTVGHIKNKDDKEQIAYFEKLLEVMRIFQVDEPELNLLKELVTLNIYKHKDSYIQVLNLLEKVELKISASSLRNCFLTTINVLYIQYNSWGLTQHHILQLFQLMVTKVQSEFYTNLSIQTIKNLATLCIRYDSKEWFDEVFAENKISHLGSEIGMTLRLCDAKFAFAAKDYQRVLDILITYKTFDVFQDLELRRLQVMSFYEMGERVLVDNYLNAFKVYIHRNETINQVYKESNNNFMRFLNRLNKTIDIKKAESILFEINQTERIAEKQWITSKANELLTKLREEK